MVAAAVEGPQTSRSNLVASVQVDPIKPDDYFLRNTEFSKWLKEQKCLMFNGEAQPPPPSQNAAFAAPGHT